MRRQFVSFSLSLALTAPSFAEVGELGASDRSAGQVLSALSPKLLRSELKVLRRELGEIDSWSALEESLKKFDEAERSFLLAKLATWKETPFQRPHFEETLSGFALRIGAQSVTFDLRSGALTRGGQSFPLHGVSMAQVYSWLADAPVTTSISSLLISEAHAVAPLVIGLISFAVTSVGILWRSSCTTAYQRTESRIRDLSGTCEWDLSQNRSSPEMRELLRSLASSQNSLLRASPRSCAEELERSHRWLFFISCSQNTDALCRKVGELARCVSALQRRGSINDTELWREGPVQERRARPRGAGASGQ